MAKNEVVYKFETREQYLAALDQVMPAKYIQTRDLGQGRKHVYLPSPIKEAIADDVFHFWTVIDENYINIANEIICTVKLNFMPNYPGAEDLVCTGTAARPIQMDAKTTVAQFPGKKKKNALEMDTPAVRIEAISNALGTLGNIFGRSLGRKLNQNTPLTPDFKIRKHE